MMPRQSSKPSTADRARRPNLLRAMSEQEVLEVVFRDGPVSRPHIAQRTGLSKATVGAVVERLEHGGIIRARGPAHGHPGRSPLTYEVRDNAGFVVGIDISPARVRARATDIFGELLGEHEQPTSSGGSREVSGQVIEVAGQVVGRAIATHGRLLAIGISTPGVVDQRTRRVTSLAYNLSPDGGFDPLSAIQERFEVPLLIENDVNLAALGESWRGAARGVSTFAFVWVGVGVGMGLVIDGELVRGAHGAAGEIGYLPSSHDPFDERHRLHGGLEDEVGATGVLEAYRRRATDGAPAAVDDAAELFVRAGTADRDAEAVVAYVAQRVGTAIASVIAVVDPELVVLGGGIGSQAALLAPVRDTVAALVPMTAAIETTTLGDQAPLYGALALGLREARSVLFTR